MYCFRNQWNNSFREVVGDPKNTPLRVLFSTLFSVFGNVMKNAVSCLIYCLRVYGFIYEILIRTTVSKRANRRLLQLIDVKRSTVLHFNVVLPPTAVVGPMITNLTSHFTVCDWRMLSIKPSWSMRATTTRRAYTLSWHLWVTRDTSKAIPARGEIFLITSYWALTSERVKAVDCIEAIVGTAWIIRCCK